jgi:carbamoyl-phosphate synthase large subunit
MKSVGEAMAMGRSFAESLQKALRGLETGLSGFDEIEIEGLDQAEDEAARHQAVLAAPQPTPDRLLVSPRPSAKA